MDKINEKESIIQELMELAEENLPVVKRTILEYGDKGIDFYLKSINHNSGTTSIDPRKDFINAVVDYLEPLLGQDVANRVANDIETFPVILTANHHGIEYLPQFMQGNILYYICRLINDKNSSTVPVLSCGGVPMRNCSYARGILMYEIEAEGINDLPCKLPVFPDKYRQAMVNLMPPFTESFVNNALKRLDKLVSTEQVNSKIGSTAKDILEEVYLKDFVLNQKKYSHQAVIVNHQIGKKIFSKTAKKPDIAYIELEAITSSLIKLDLLKSSSLAYVTLFNENLCEKIISNLDGKRICWDTKKLQQLTSEELSKDERSKLIGGSGTHFFWGVEENFMRYPLMLVKEKGKTPKLVGREGSGVERSFEFTTSNIIELLKNDKIMPSVFMCFLVIAFARNYGCLGGYFQGDYLKAIKKGMEEAFSEFPEYFSYKNEISNVPCDYYLSGPMFAGIKKDKNLVLPAGTIEIIAGGGFDERDLEKISEINIEEAHHLGIYNLYPDIANESNWIEDWQQRLGEELFKTYNEKFFYS